MFVQACSSRITYLTLDEQLAVHRDPNMRQPYKVRLQLRTHSPTRLISPLSVSFSFPFTIFRHEGVACYIRRSLPCTLEFDKCIEASVSKART